MKRTLFKIGVAVALLWVAVIGISPSVPSVAESGSSVTITKYASDGTTVLSRTIVTYQWMESDLPVLGDGVTHYYHQGPVFVNGPDEASEQQLRWNSEENTNVQQKDMGAVKGTNVKDLCNLVGGMSTGDRLEVKAIDGLSEEFAYKNVYEYSSREGPMGLTWCKDGSYPDTGYVDGMRLVWFADASVNPWGVHAFGNWDWHEAAAPEFWYYYTQGSERYPTTTGLSVKYISELNIHSTQPPPVAAPPPLPPPPIAAFSADVISGIAPLQVHFTDQSMGSPSTWAWDFDNDGTADSSDANPKFTFTAAGIYTVKLTAANVWGSSSEVKANYITVDASPRQILWGPYLTGTTSTGTVVNIKTDVATTGAVEYAAEADYAASGVYNRTATDGLSADLHHFKLSGLAPDTTYHYRVTYGKESSGDLHFHTFPKSGPFTFVVFSDPQDQLPTFSSSERFKLVADRVAAEPDVAFALISGDQVSDGNDLASWGRFFDAGRGMMSSIPVYPALGNHEGKNSLYKDVFDLPSYYSFDCADAHFTILDSNDWAWGNLPTQTTWLNSDLETTKTWKFVSFHHPLYTSEAKHFGGWQNLRTEWEGVFLSRRVDAVWNGDVHAYERYLEQGISYLVMGTGGGPTYQLSAEKYSGYQSSLENSLAYAKVSVDPVAGTATIQIIRVADISPDDSQVTKVYPQGSVFESLVLTQPKPPIANFKSDVTSGNTPLDVRFIDESTGTAPLTYAWDFNNDGIVDSTEESPTYSYASAGSYSVKLTVTNSVGSVDRIRQDYIVVTPAPTPTPTPISTPLPVPTPNPGPTATPDSKPKPTSVPVTPEIESSPQTGATTEVRLGRYAADGITVMAEKTVSFQWMQQNLPIYGDGKTHYYHQGPVFEGDPWDPEETANLKDKGAVEGTALKDLCDLIGGMSPGDEVMMTAVDGWHTEFAYANIYQPADSQGVIALCWFNGEDALIGERSGEGYPANNGYSAALQIVFMADTANRQGKYVFGNTDMRTALPEEKYQHFYEGRYPSTNGLSGKWISEVRIYNTSVKPDVKIDVKPADVPSNGNDEGSMPWIPIVLGVAGLSFLGWAIYVWRKKGRAG